MKATDYKKAFDALALNLNILINNIPDQMKQAEKKLSETDKKKINEVLNSVDLKGKLEELRQKRQELDDLIRQKNA